jgi:hypothetical protein
MPLYGPPDNQQQGNEAFVYASASAIQRRHKGRGPENIRKAGQTENIAFFLLLFWQKAL